LFFHKNSTRPFGLWWCVVVVLAVAATGYKKKYFKHMFKVMFFVQKVMF